VIGGLMRDLVTTTQSKVPLLGDIPLIGALFRKTTNNKSKQNLLLFLTPYIVRSQADLRAIYERKVRERQEFLDRYFVFGTHDYHPTVDWSRTRGLVAEIVRQVDTMQEDRRLSDELASKPSPDHVPRPSVGSMRRPGEADASGPAEGDMVIEGGQTVPPAGSEPAPTSPEPAPAAPAPAPDASGPGAQAPTPAPARVGASVSTRRPAPATGAPRPAPGTSGDLPAGAGGETAGAAADTAPVPGTTAAPPAGTNEAATAAPAPATTE
jgi:general secretion pathway protein D